MTLADIWFVLIGVLFAGYAVLDGFDLGVGVLYPFIARNEEERTVLRSCVGPFWDGNEVWLLTGGGALFAAFPPVYATVFSGFYLALMLVLFALIFRAVSLEFRTHDPEWASVWDWAFSLGSALPALLFGVAVGNIMRGIPLATDGEFAGTFFTLLNPYALVIGLLGLAAIVAHGAGWAVMKSEGALRRRAATVRSTASWVFVALAAVSTAATVVFAPDAFANVTGRPAGWLFVVVLVAGVVWSRLSMARDDDLQVFVGSSAEMIALVGIWATGIFPALVPALDSPALSLTVANASSSHLTLTVMLIIAGIGVPIVLAYTALLYRVFRGKVAAGGGY